MASAPPDLWPENIPAGVLTPLAVMRSQAARLKEKTGGRLDCEVRSTRESEAQTGVTGTDQWVHSFEVVAPALNGYRHQLFVAFHPAALAYPVFVQSGYFPPGVYAPEAPFITAMTQDGFLELVGQILRSPGTASVLQSLIARTNEANGTGAGG